MKRSLAKLHFSEIIRLASVKKGFIWRTMTLDVPGDSQWSIRVKFLEDLKSDFTASAIVQFLVPEAEFLHAPGTEFQLFSANKFKCECTIIKEI